MASICCLKFSQRKRGKGGPTPTSSLSIESQQVYLSSLCFLGLLNRLEEPLQVLRLLLQELDFLLTRLGIIFALLVDDALNSFDLGLLLKFALHLFFLALLELTLLGGELSSTMLSLQLLAHGKRH